MNSHVYSCHLENVLSFVSYTLTAKTNNDSYEDMSLYYKLSFVGLKKIMEILQYRLVLPSGK